MSNTDTRKRTVLWNNHRKYGARFTDFAGYELPVQFSAGILKEHMAVRETGGLFDTCHMPEFLCNGPEALSAINYLFTNDYTDLRIDTIRYGMMLNEAGGVLDDLFVHRLAEDVFLITMNAATRKRDFQWMVEKAPEAQWRDLSDEIGTVALQGPAAEAILRRVASPQAIPKGRFHLQQEARISRIPALVARTGYSGEDGFEIYVKQEDTVALWDLLAEAGAPLGLLPCGLGARDTLRIEAGMPLYGRELTEEITPLEAALPYGLALDRSDFIGRQALLAQPHPAVCRVGLRVLGRGILRQGHALLHGERSVGRVTSGTYCAYEQAALAMGYVEPAFAAPGTVLTASVRGRQVQAVVEPLPFYTPAYRRRQAAK